jgi:hypothetical protein
MEEKQTASGPQAHSGCFVCGTVLPFLEKLRFPDDTRQHFRNSRVEFLKAMRTIIDHKISHLSPDEGRGTHVTVE